VSIAPGAITLTLIFCSTNSKAAVLAKLMTAPFDAIYGALFIPPEKANCDAVITTDDCLALFKFGRKEISHSQLDLTLTSKISSQSLLVP